MEKERSHRYKETFFFPQVNWSFKGVFQNTYFVNKTSNRIVRLKFNEILSTSNPQYQTETSPKTYHASKILLCRTTSNHPVRQTLDLNKRKTGKLLPSLYSCAHRVKEAIALLLDNIANLQRPSPLRLRPSCETVVRGGKNEEIRREKEKRI